MLFPAITVGQIRDIVATCGAASLLAAGYAAARRLRAGTPATIPIDRTGKDSWRMPPLALLARPVMSTGRKIGMSALPSSQLLSGDLAGHRLSQGVDLGEHPRLIVITRRGHRLVDAHHRHARTQGGLAE